jgi:predicted TIM-barrel fold metal-dependent hydrolase
LSLRHNGFRHDWPHPVSVVEPPNDADLLEFAPDTAERQRILVGNPARLFGF